MVGGPGCARSPRRVLSRVLGAGGESDTKENPRHSAQPKRLRGRCGGDSLLLRWALELCLVRRRVLRFWARGAGLSRGRPTAYPRAPVIVLSLFVIACSHFVSCRVVMRCHWVSPRVFLIVYAPAMRAVAYYALGCGCSCASHGAALSCLVVLWCVGFPRVGVWSVWRSARLRARACWQYTCVILRGGYDERVWCGASGARPGSPPGVIG